MEDYKKNFKTANGLSKDVNNVNISLVPFRNGTNTISNVFQKNKFIEEDPDNDDEENDAVDDSQTMKIIGNYRNLLYENVLRELKDLFKKRRNQPSVIDKDEGGRTQGESDKRPNTSVINQTSIAFGCEFSSVDIEDLEKRSEILETQENGSYLKGSMVSVNLMAPKPYHVFLKEYQERKGSYVTRKKSVNDDVNAPFFNIGNVNDEIFNWDCTNDKMIKKVNVLDNCLDDIIVDITKHSLDIKHDIVNNINGDCGCCSCGSKFPDDVGNEDLFRKIDRKVQFSEDVKVILNDGNFEEDVGMDKLSSEELGIQSEVIFIDLLCLLGWEVLMECYGPEFV